MQKTETILNARVAESIPAVNYTETSKTKKTFGKAFSLGQPKEKFGQVPKTVLKYGKEAIQYILGFLGGHVAVFQIFNPVGTAFLSTCFFEGKTFYIMSGAVLAGLLMGNVPYVSKYILCLIFCLIQNFVLSGRIKKPSPFLKAICGSTSLALAGLVFAAVNGMSPYLTFMAFMEAAMVFSFTFVVGKGVELLKGGMKRKILTSEEIISLSLILAVAIAGSAEVHIRGVPLKYIFSTAAILVAGYRGGAGIGAATGVLIGFALLVCGKIDMAMFCAFSLSGLLCGGLKEIGRLATVFSFIIGILILIFYMDKELLNQAFLIGIGMGGLLFLAVPKRAFAFINTYACYENEFNEDQYYIRMKEMTEQKLKQFSKAFYALSKTFERTEERKGTMDKIEISKTIDQVAAHACKGCGLSVYCWETDFYNTYQTVFNAFSKCESKGILRSNDLPKAFAQSCVRMDSFVEAINRLYELYKSNAVWKSKIEESRELVSEQLNAVGHIIEGLAGKLDMRVIFKQSLEKEVRAALDKARIHVEKVSVMENLKGGMEVDITHLSCFGKRLCYGQIIPIVNKVLGKKMKKENGLGCAVSADGVCCLRLIEESQMKLSTGVASKTKTESSVSGDSYTFMESENGLALMALSDGMGSGIGANRESTDTIELLEQFIDSGFEKDLAVKMINSVLILKSSEDIFATLDICSVDLYTGKAEFIKIGAAATFLVRDGKVHTIRSETLPVGVLNQIELDKNDVMLKAGDVILMMTDGVADVVYQKAGDEKWFEEIFEQFHCNNPQDIAQYILIQAQKKAEGVIKDDMTVLAARVWEK